MEGRSGDAGNAPAARITHQYQTTSLTSLGFAVNLALAAAFVITYYFSYLLFLNRYFDYSGYWLFSRSAEFVVFSGLVAVVPIALYRGFRAISSAICVFIYIVLYVPIVLTFALGSGRPVEEIVLLQLVFMACMSLLFVADRVIIKNPLQMYISSDLVRGVALLTILATGYILFVYRGNLRLVSLAEIYVQRSANSDLGGDVLTRYLSSWLATAFAPICLAYGLVAKRYRYFLIGTVSCVVLYMASATKATIFLPFLYPAFYLFFSGARLRRIFPLVAASLTVVITVLLAITKLGTMTFLASSILLSRTIGNGGLLTMSYYDFFSFYPRTEYSHLNFVQTLFPHAYPYGDKLLGQVVGQYYWSIAMNANANFWATDGIAALGLIGVPIVTIACAGLFLLMNSITRRNNQLFVLLCFIPFMLFLLNASLFSSFISGGAVLVLAFFLFDGGPSSPELVPVMFPDRSPKPPGRAG